MLENFKLYRPTGFGAPAVSDSPGDRPPEFVLQPSGHFRFAEAFGLQIPITYRRRSRFIFVTEFVTTGIQLFAARTEPAIRNYVAPLTPTAASEIFTPGPMVDEMEIFFI
jgi:hypothetical protein